VTASLGVTRRRSLCRHELLTAVWLNTTISGSNSQLSERIRFGGWWILWIRVPVLIHVHVLIL